MKKIMFFCSLFTLLLVISNNLFAQAKTTIYTYDALGRLTFVNDSVNGNRDYDYDKAGNRTSMTVGQSVDDPVVVLPKPTGLSWVLVNPQYMSYNMVWNSVSGATYYLLTLNSSPAQTVQVAASSGATVNYSQMQFRGTQVKACNPSACSEPAYF